MTEKESAVRKIMGKDIVFPKEIAEKMAIFYLKEEEKELEKMMPSEETLRWAKAHNYAVLACPPDPVSFLQVRGFEPSLFYSESEGFCSGIYQSFAKNDKTDFGWLVARKDIVPKSRRKNWQEQISLLNFNERVPNAGEFAWFLVAYFKVRGLRLFEDTYVRTASVLSDRSIVNMGNFDSRGIDIQAFWHPYRDDNLGVSSFLKIK